MLVFRPGDRITVAGGEHGARLILLGGATLGPRYLWWNFVASSQERIEAAKEAWRKADWGHGRFDLPPDDRDEFTPAPERAFDPLACEARATFFRLTGGGGSCGTRTSVARSAVGSTRYLSKSRTPASNRNDVVDQEVAGEAFARPFRKIT